MQVSPRAPAQVSVALPVRDAERWLEEALASVLAQTEARLEVLAVDDGSSDRSGEILQAFAARDRRVRVLSTAPDRRGLVAALNLAAEVASAPYLARMDADDVMHPRRLEAQVAALEYDPTLFAVGCLAEAFPEENLGDGMRAYLDWQHSLASAGEIARDRFVESPLLHPSVTMRTLPLREMLGGWRDEGWPEDWDLFLRAFEAGMTIGRVGETLHRWRLHDGQLTRTDARYSPTALLALRAHFLARHLRQPPAKGRPLWILGAGPVGKALVKALAREGVVADGLADVDPRKIGGVVRDGTMRWRVVDHECALMAPGHRPYAVSAVAGAAARSRVRAELARLGWTEGADFVVAA